MAARADHTPHQARARRELLEPQERGRDEDALQELVEVPGLSDLR